MLTYLDLLKAWTVCLGVATLHTVVLAFNTGRLRGVHKSYATQEDFVKNGSPSDGIVGDKEPILRSNNAHRNQLENFPPFIAASVLFVLVASAAQYGKNPSFPLEPTDRDFTAGIILFVIWTFTRIGHSIAYLNALQPWRTICFGTSATTVVVITLYAIINVFVNTPNDN